jgi:two-component system, LytTR family, sensor histidine kinase AlgZ
MFFDVCHGALAWRALLMVNGALLVAAVAAASTLAEALALGGPLMVVGLVGTALWLSGVCTARSLLQRMSLWQRRGSVMALGALVGVAGMAVQSWMLMAPLSSWRWGVGALVGGALAAALAMWIEQRSQALRPASNDARLAELQARIRPHFLFNTLNTATALVRVDPPAAETMLEDLADLFRAALAHARTCTLAEEVAVARQYLAIEQRRFGSRMSVRWDLDAATDGAQVPSLVLQPLVENAVHHGVESMREGAWIVVRTRAVRGRATIEIENNVGAETPSGHGIALANVRERLRLLHDVDGRFDARLEDGRYVVRLSLPLNAQGIAVKPASQTTTPIKPKDEVTA